MRIRMRMAGLADWNYWWSNPHPGNPKMSMPASRNWIDQQWKHIDGKLDRNAIVPPDQYAHFDEKVALYELWYVPEWPTAGVMARRLNTDGTFQSHPAWVERLYESIKKHGIKDPVFAYGHHVPTQRVDGPAAELARVVLGNNRVAVAKHYGIKSIPVVTTVDRGDKPPFPGERISFERYHDGFMGHRADLWCAPEDIFLVHPPTVFYDETEGGCKKVAPL